MENIQESQEQRYRRAVEKTGMTMREFDELYLIVHQNDNKTRNVENEKAKQEFQFVQMNLMTVQHQNAILENKIQNMKYLKKLKWINWVNRIKKSLHISKPLIAGK